MKEQVFNRAKAFQNINELAMKGEVVVFGSTYMSRFPFYELVNKSQLEHAVYNRSIEGMTLDEAAALLPTCVLELQPEKVFLQLGETDWNTPDAEKKYAAIVRAIREALPAAVICLIDLPQEEAEDFNRKIAALCDGKTVHHIDLAAKSPAVNQFKQMSRFFRSHPITFPEAFAIAQL